MNMLHSTLSAWRDRLAPISHTSTFRTTGQITPEEFVLAGDYLVYKFPTWSWADSASPSKRVPHLPEGKQFLVTRGVPCHRRLDENFAGTAGREDVMVGGDDGDAWLSTGGMTESREARIKDVKTMDDSGNVGDEDEEEEIPDMEDDADDDEAIIREPAAKSDDNSSTTRTYNLYITYSPYYRTPRLYLSGYVKTSEPLPPHLMMEDIVGDYKDKTVTLEDFPFFDGGAKMASVHPCKHANVMKVLLDRADAALKIRRSKIAAKREEQAKVETGLEGLVDDMKKMDISDQPGSGSNDDWEVLQSDGSDDDDIAIRVDQYLVVFLKFIASVTPGIEHDYTMGL